MKKQEIDSAGSNIVKSIFAEVARSKDKSVWRNAIKSIGDYVAELPEDSTDLKKAFLSAKKELKEKFKIKFSKNK